MGKISLVRTKILRGRLDDVSIFRVVGFRAVLTLRTSLRNIDEEASFGHGLNVVFWYWGTKTLLRSRKIVNEQKVLHHPNRKLLTNVFKNETSKRPQIVIV